MWLQWETLCERLKFFRSSAVTTLSITVQGMTILQETLQWIIERRVALETMKFGVDLPSVEKATNDHEVEHKVVLAFRSKVEECVEMKVRG